LKPRLALTALFVVAASPAAATTPPEAIRAMVINALATDDPATIAAVVSVAKQTAPDSVQEIDDLVSGGLPPAPVVTPAVARPPEPTTPPRPAWKGALEIGGGRSTGNSETLGVYGAADLSRTSGDWTHKLTARADYQETGGAPTTERIAVAYQPQFKLDPVFYTYGLAQYEHDKFLGYESRYTAGAGIGLAGVERPDLRISFDVGPALRRTEFYASGAEDTVAGRGAVAVKWVPFPRLTVAQDMAVYLERGNTTAKSTTAVDTKLFGPLKARLSYNIQYERDAPAGQREVDTTSRASLVYSF